MASRDLLNLDQLIAKLGKSRDWWFRNRDRLERDLGFPPRVPGMGQSWDPAAIDAWLDAQMPAHLKPAEPSAQTEEQIIADAARRMDERAESFGDAA